MDYMDTKQIKFYKNYDEFLNSKKNQRIILITTKAKNHILILILNLMIQFFLEEKALEYLKTYIKL